VTGIRLAPPGEVAFHNLAELGALSHTLPIRQLPRALRLSPTIATVLVGVNDTLRSTFDVGRIGAAMSQVIGDLTAEGAMVLTARLPDPGRMFGLPACLARPLARRIAAVNAVMDAVADLHKTVHFDAANHARTYDRLMWSVDRLHPSERGHRLLATSFADLLVARGVNIYLRPSPEPTSRPPTRMAQATWIATRGTKWLYDRSTDLVPISSRWPPPNGGTNCVGSHVASTSVSPQTWCRPVAVLSAVSDPTDTFLEYPYPAHPAAH
jgi:lysophospholipase L1-like esterase